MNAQDLRQFRSAYALRALAVFSLCTAAALPLAARANLIPGVTGPVTTLPEELQYHGIAYISGGVTPDAARVFRDHMSQYPLAVELVEAQAVDKKRDEFTAEAKVRIQRDGRTVFRATSDGPYMLVKLEPGTYSMTATLADHTLRKTDFTIEPHQTTRATFIFPAGTD